MNWYEHHIKDYAAAVMYHSWDEDMAYSRMLRLYYRKEQPLPGDPAEVARLIGATEPHQRAAVDVILRDFFTLEADGLHHNDKCDEVIAAYHAGQPEREAKKVNEDTRLARHRAERAELFKLLNSAGEHLPYNAPIAQVRQAVQALRVSGRVSGGVAGEGGSPSVAMSPATPATPPETGNATLATATHPPLPTTQSPLGISVPSVPLAPDPAGPAPATPATVKPKRVRKPRVKTPEDEGPTVAVWRAYSLAYADVYGVEPTRNAMVNGQLARLIDQLGKDDAVHVAAFYVRQPFYRAKCHPVGVLLADAQGLHTRWKMSQRGLPDPATVGPRLDDRTQYRNNRMAEALGSYAGVAGAAAIHPPAANGARQPYDLEADDDQRPALPAPGRR